MLPTTLKHSRMSTFAYWVTIHPSVLPHEILSILQSTTVTEFTDTTDSIARQISVSHGGWLASTGRSMHIHAWRKRTPS